MVNSWLRDNPVFLHNHNDDWDITFAQTPTSPWAPPAEQCPTSPDEGGSNEGTRNLQHARDYANHYLRDGTPGPFTEIFSLRLFADKGGRDFYARPAITWSANHQILYHKGKPLVIAKLQSAVRALVTWAKDWLCRYLIFNNHNVLRRQSPRGRFNNIVWANVSDNFLSFRQNNLH